LLGGGGGGGTVPDSGGQHVVGISGNNLNFNSMASGVELQNDVQLL